MCTTYNATCKIRIFRQSKQMENGGLMARRVRRYVKSENDVRISCIHREVQNIWSNRHSNSFVNAVDNTALYSTSANVGTRCREITEMFGELCSNRICQQGVFHSFILKLVFGRFCWGLIVYLFRSFFSFWALQRMTTFFLISTYLQLIPCSLFDMNVKIHLISTLLLHELRPQGELSWPPQLFHKFAYE